MTQTPGAPRWSYGAQPPSGGGGAPAGGGGPGLYRAASGATGAPHPQQHSGQRPPPEAGVQRAHANPQLPRVETVIPPCPTHFDQIEKMSVEELRTHLGDSASFDRFILDLPHRRYVFIILFSILTAVRCFLCLRVPAGVRVVMAKEGRRWF